MVFINIQLASVRKQSFIRGYEKIEEVGALENRETVKEEDALLGEVFVLRLEDGDHWGEGVP